MIKLDNARMGITQDEKLGHGFLSQAGWLGLKAGVSVPLSLRVVSDTVLTLRVSDAVLIWGVSDIMLLWGTFSWLSLAPSHVEPLPHMCTVLRHTPG